MVPFWFKKYAKIVPYNLYIQITETSTHNTRAQESSVLITDKRKNAPEKYKKRKKDTAMTNLIRTYIENTKRRKTLKIHAEKMRLEENAMIYEIDKNIAAEEIDNGRKDPQALIACWMLGNKTITRRFPKNTTGKDILSFCKGNRWVAIQII